MSQDEQAASTGPVQVPTTPPSWTASSRQRYPEVLSGQLGDDVEDWLKNYDRVKSFNHWDDVSKLRNTAFYVT